MTAGLARASRFAVSVFVGAALVLMLFVPATQPVSAQTTDEMLCGINLEGAIKFIAGLQNDDGGFSDGFSPESKIGATADAVVAFVHAGEDPTLFKKGEKTPLSYLAGEIKAGKLSTVGEYGKVLYAAILIENGLPGVNTPDLVKQTQEILGKDIDKSGYYGQALALLALAISGADVPTPAVERLLKTKDAATNGYSFGPDTKPDTNTTALIVQLLNTLDRRDDARPSLDYLRSLQNDDKGWPYQKPSDFGTDSDSNSTALVIMAIITSNEMLDSWGNPQTFLKTFQQKDGSFTFQLKQPAPSFLATVQVIPTLCAATESEPAPTPAETPAQ